MFCSWLHKEQSKNTRSNCNRSNTDSSAQINNFISCSCKWSFELPRWLFFFFHFHHYVMNWSNLAHFCMAPTTSHFIGTFPPTIGLTFLKPCAQAKPSPCHLCRGLKGSWPVFREKGNQKITLPVDRVAIFWGELIFWCLFSKADPRPREVRGVPDFRSKDGGRNWA